MNRNVATAPCFGTPILALKFVPEGMHKPLGLYALTTEDSAGEVACFEKTSQSAVRYQLLPCGILFFKAGDPRSKSRRARPIIACSKSFLRHK
jgi:hypothetical protein